MTEATETCPTLHDVVTTTLGGFRLSNPGATKEIGLEQISMMADEIVVKVIETGPECAIATVMEALAPGKPADAALNLEGAIDTLLIAHRFSEDDTVVRTMRRVLGQIVMAQASIEIELARKMTAPAVPID